MRIADGSSVAWLAGPWIVLAFMLMVVGTAVKAATRRRRKG